MTLLSLTAFAATHAASRQAAKKWQDAGFLTMRDGMVDQEASDATMERAAKGRFRLKAHGGRRAAGVKGVRDRPGIDGPRVASAPTPDPWAGWAWLGNSNNPLSKAARKAIAADEGGAADEVADLIDYSEWENACTHLGWKCWPAQVAATLASDLGLHDAAQVEVALQRHVHARFAALGVELSDLSDTRLVAR